MLAACAAFFFFWCAGIRLLEARSGLPQDSAEYQAMAIHILMGAYFAHLLARTLVMSLQYKKEVLHRHFKDSL